MADDDGRSWMYPENRICDVYLNSLKSSFIATAEADMLTNKKSAMWCPCKDCKNELQFENVPQIYMVQKVTDEGLSVGILDPSMFLRSHIRSNESSVVEYLQGVLNHYEKEPESLIMFPHNTGDHWLLVVIIPKWSKVLYLDSQRAKQRDHHLLKTVINKAFALSNYNKKSDKGALLHATKFVCHRQPIDRTCGFYTAHHMTLALAAATCEDPSDFEVPNTVLDRSVLFGIREMIASFLMSQIGMNQ